MKRVFRIFAFTLSLVFIFSTLSFADQPIKIAHFEIMSGPYKSVGEYFVETLQWMAKDINRRGGVLGRPLEIKFIDHEFKPDVLTRKAKETMESYKPDFLMHFASSSLGLVLNHIAKRSKVVYVVGAAETDELTGEKGHEYIFRTCANAKIRAKAVAVFLKDKPEYKKVCLLNPDNAYGYSMNKAAKKYISEVRPDMQFQEVLNPMGTKDYGPYMTKINHWGADLVLTGNYGPDLARIVGAAAKFGLKAKILTYYLHDLNVLNAVGKAALGQLVLGPAPRVNPQRSKMWEDFLLRYHKAHKNMSGMMAWPVDYAENALAFIKAALEKAGTVDTQAFIKAAEGLTFEGSNGPIYMRQCDHQAQQQMFVREFVMGNKYMPDSVAGGRPIMIIPAKDITIPPAETGNPNCK